MERSLFKMLFLLKVEIKKIPDIPIKDFFGFIIKEWEYFIRMKKRGKILAGGKLAGSPLLQRNHRGWMVCHRVKADGLCVSLGSKAVKLPVDALWAAL